MKSSDYIVRFIKERGTKKVFAFTGGAISHVIDSFRHFENDIQYVCVQNEQVGAMAAEGYSRSSDKMGVMLATSGPGATNLVTGIAGSYYDCIPVVFIVGQVRTWEMSGDAKLLQRGFQEIDIVNMVSKITKYAKTITQEEDIRYELEKAWHLARTGRPGPVLIDLPMNMQWADIEPNQLRSFDSELSQHPSHIPESDSIEPLIEALSKSKKPLVIAGGGIAHSNARDKFQSFIKKFRLPVIKTYGGRDTIADDNPFFCGILGQFGTPAANVLTGQSDLIISIGTRLTLRQVGNSPNLFGPNAIKISINIDQGELVDGYVKQDICICADINDTLNIIESRLIQYQHRQKWLGYCKSLVESLPIITAKENKDFVSPYSFMRYISSEIDENSTLVADTGQSLVYATQALNLSHSNRLFSSWAHSPMGYSVAAALGVCLANPEKQVIAIIGDGGMHVNLQDLQTLVTYNIPVKILLFNNKCYGLIQEFQDPNLNRHYAATDAKHGYQPPNYKAIANAFNIPYFHIERNNNKQIFRDALNEPGPTLCEVNIDPSFRVSGMIPGANATHEISQEYKYSHFEID